MSLPDGRVFQRVGGVYVQKIAQDVQSGKWNDAEAGAAANALTVNLTPLPGGYTAGMLLNIIIPFDCDELATLSVNELPAKPIVRGYNQRPLVEKDWRVDRIVT
ncbi:hypothetical protein [Paenochrobactrum glaciei]|uniref:Uncharacterized protein n=1 Tax=Paenochrobactrum glaciei TaxID=486407 RepID=A0ABP3RYL9_9HYPH